MLDILVNTPPWDWPEDAGESLQAILVDRTRTPEDRLLAAELCGDFVVASEEMASALLAIARDPAEAPELRGRSAVSLGPMLEDADTNLPEFPEDIEISSETFELLKVALRSLYDDEDAPTFLRRMALEGAVRAQADWLGPAIRAAWADGDPDWRLTAVFCMNFVAGFETEIIAALGDPDPIIKNWAVVAAGTWELKEAWFVVSSILKDETEDKDMLLAAIEAAPLIRPREAFGLLDRFLDSPDPDLEEAAHEALSMIPED